MRTRIDGRISGNERTLTITMRGSDDDFIQLIDEGSGRNGTLGNLAAMIAKATGLVDERTDDRAQAARLMRRAAEILERNQD